MARPLQLNLQVPSTSSLGSSGSSGPQSPDSVSDSVLVAFARFSNVAQTVKEYCPRIRVLVMGRRNAGKTTLLKKMTNSSDGRVEFRDQGKKVNPGNILEPSVERGGSHIEYEITYPSDSDYVFHDSRGMEAGSDEELQFLRDFMEHRKKQQIMKNQLHVIWLCLPVDNDRPLGPHEMAFFQDAGTGGVPIIAIFTKFEWRVTKAYDVLREAGKGHSEAKREAPRLARDEFERTIVQQRFHDGQVSHKPIRCIYLQDMDQGGSCDELTETTTWVVQNAVNNKLFGEIKDNSVRVSMAIALINSISLTKIKTDLAVGRNSKVKEWTIFLLSLFPYWDAYLKVEHQWKWDFSDTLFDLGIKIDRERARPVDVILDSCISWIDPSARKDLQLLTYFVDVIMIAEHSFWFKDRKPWDHLGPVISQYKICPQRIAIRSTVQKLFVEMNDPAYQHAAFKMAGPLASNTLQALALKYMPMLRHHRFLSITPDSSEPLSP